MTVKTVPQFLDGRVVMHGDFAPGGDVLLEDPIRRIVSRSAGGKLTLDACRPNGIDNLLVCSPTVDVDDAVATAFVEPLGGASVTDVIVRAPWSELSRGHSEQPRTVRLSCGSPGSGKVIEGQARFTELSPIHRASGAVPIGGIRLDVISDSALPAMSAGELRERINGLAAGRLPLDGQVQILARPEAATPLLTDIAKKVEPETRQTGTMFSYVFSVCYAAERLGSPECVEALTILADKPGISGSSVPRGADPRSTARGSVSMRGDRYAYIEFCLGRALAHGGSRRGYQIPAKRIGAG